jgi:uncharacterized membrane protein
MIFTQVAKLGRRARQAAEQTSSMEESRHVRKSSSSTSMGEVAMIYDWLSVLLVMFYLPKTKYHILLVMAINVTAYTSPKYMWIISYAWTKEEEEVLYEGT